MKFNPDLGRGLFSEEKMTIERIGRIEKGNIFVAFGAMMLCLLLFPIGTAEGFGIGVILGAVNFCLIRIILKKLLLERNLQKAIFYLVFYFIKLSALTVLIYFFIMRYKVEAVPFGIGLSLHLLSILIFGLLSAPQEIEILDNQER